MLEVLPAFLLLLLLLPLSGFHLNFYQSLGLIGPSLEEYYLLDSMVLSIQLLDDQEEVEPCWHAGRIHGTSVSPLRSFGCFRSRPTLPAEFHDL